jgi:hypothetical protein
MVGVGTRPFGLAVHPNGTRVYVANTIPTGPAGFGGGIVSVIDTIKAETDPANAQIDQVNVASAAYGVAVTPDGAQFYHAGNPVSVVDTATNMMIDTVFAGFIPQVFGQFIADVKSSQSFPLGWPFIESTGWAITGYGTGDCKGINEKIEGDHCGDDWYAQDWNFDLGGNSDLGKVLLSAVSGQVIFAQSVKGSVKGYGQEVIVQLSQPFNDFALRYTHLQEVWVKKGVIAQPGSKREPTGESARWIA